MFATRIAAIFLCFAAVAHAQDAPPALKLPAGVKLPGMGAPKAAAVAPAPAEPSAPAADAPVIAAPPAPSAPTVTVTSVAPTAPKATDKPITREELPALVKQILLDDPEIIMEVAQKMQEKQLADSQKQAKDALKKYHDDLFNNPDAPRLGDAKKADVTLVEFFDYHCGYCKRLLPTLVKLTEEDKKLSVVFKEFPILSEDSVLASRAALAANRIAKDKYFDFHSALMKHNGKYDEKTLMEIAKKVGINADKLKKEMDKPDVTVILDKNRELGEALGVRGTPAMVIGDTLLPGALPYEDIKSAIENARKGTAD